MTYEIETGPMLVAISRAEILDISIGDSLQIRSFPETHYTWQQQDSELVENNPDADIFLRIEKTEDGQYHARGIELR